MEPARIQAYLQENMHRYLELLRQMVETNSFTAHATGVNLLGEMTARAFEASGFQAEFVQSVNPAFGRHLFLKRIAVGSAPTIVLVSHLDTVFPPEEEKANDFTWRREGDRIYGPGTVDIKGGTLLAFMVLEALQAAAPWQFERVNWLVCLDASEEALSHDFTSLCLQKMPPDTLACLVFEGGTPKPGVFPIVVARKGRAAFTIRVEGKSAHAGNYHHLGANAIVQLAHTIQKVAALTDYDQQITFNVGKVSGGTVINRVPHLAEAQLEMRCFTPQVFDAGVSAMLALGGTSEVVSQDGFRCRVQVNLGEQTAPWPANPATERLYTIWEAAAQAAGLSLVREQRGGLSDGNLLWQRVPTLDGLGPTGDNAHCSERSADGSKDQEYALESSFIPKAVINTLAILSLLEGQVNS